MLRAVFFYGLFMDVDLLRQQGLKPQAVQQACLPGHRLVIGQRASLIEDANACVYGLTMTLTEDELQGLYSAPSVADYREQVVEVEAMAGQRFEVSVYVLPQSQVSGSNEAYASRLAQLASELGLPVDYVAEIKGRK